MSSDGRVRVVVAPRRVPVGTTLVRQPLFSTWGGLVGYKTSRVVLYDSILDEEHQRAMEEARRISSMLGLEMEVVVAKRWGLFGRILSSLGLAGSGHPAIVVSPSYGAFSCGSSQAAARAR